MRELLLATIADQPDIDVVAEISEESDIPHIVKETSPEFLIIGLDATGRRPAICDLLLKLHPELKIIALASERNFSMFYWASFDIHSTSVESSEVGVLQTLRSNANVESNS